MKSTLKETTARRYWPLREIVLARLREFYREPEALFWVYGFPILLIVGLGIAFRNTPIEKMNVDVQEGPGAEAVAKALSAHEKFVVKTVSTEQARLDLRNGRTELVVMTADSSQPSYDYLYDPSRPQSMLARNAVDDALQRAAGRQDVVRVTEQEFNEPGGRYIDFLVPGLLGMSLMGGGLWGVGFVTVDMRIRKLTSAFWPRPCVRPIFWAAL